MVKHKHLLHRDRSILALRRPLITPVPVDAEPHKAGIIWDLTQLNGIVCIKFSNIGINTTHYLLY